MNEPQEADPIGESIELMRDQIAKLLVKAGKVRAYERLLDTYGVTGEKKKELMEQFKRDAVMILRSSGRLLK